MDKKVRGLPGVGAANKVLAQLIKSDPFATVDKDNEETRSRLLKVSILCVFFMIIEIVGGYVSNSIAIMSDAAHLLSDLLSFFVSIFALRLSARGINRNYTFGYHRAEVLGALGSISVIWILTLWLLIEAFDRFISPPTDFNPFVMMVTAFLGICVNLIMGFTLNQGGHKHFHSHLMGGSCSHDHDHGHSHGPANGDYELMDLEVPKKPYILRSRSMDIKCERNYDKNEYHHHHIRAEELNCCDEKDCPEPKDPKVQQNGTEIATKKHEHTSACNHKHDDEEGKGGKKGHDHNHDHGHNHDHKDDHGHDHKKDHGRNHDHAHGHDHHHGHNHIHDHDQGSNYSIDGMNVNLRAAFVHIVGDLVQSIGVFFIAVVIWWKPEWQWFDPLCTVLFSIIVIFTTVPVSQECCRVLMEATPVKFDLQHLSSQIAETPGVYGVYEIRVWMINESRTALSAKVLVDKYSSSTLARIKSLCADYKISSSTIELKIFDN